MKKLKVLALVLILSLLMMPSVARAGGDTTYLALGDSIAYGHGASTTTSYVANYLNYDKSVVPGSGYTDMFYTYLSKVRGVENYINVSRNGVTSEQLKNGLLNPGSGAYLPMGSDDFITISIGGNDVLGPLKNFVLAHPEYLVEGYFESKISDVKNLPPELIGLISQLTINSINFKSNWKSIMGNLQKRTDATMIVNTVFNPFPVGSALNLFTSPFLATINTPIRAMSRTYGYKVADISMAFVLLNSAKKPLVHDLTKMNVALHPNDRGYMVIYLANEKLLPTK